MEAAHTVSVFPLPASPPNTHKEVSGFQSAYVDNQEKCRTLEVLKMAKWQPGFVSDEIKEKSTET